MSLNQKNPQSASSALNPHFRIVLASGIYPPDIGGPATYSQLIAQEFVKRGIDVAVICYSDDKLFEMSEMLDVRNEQFEQVSIKSRRSNKRNDSTSQTPQTSQAFKLIRISRKHNILIRYLIYFWKLSRLARDTETIYAQGPLGAGLPAFVVAKILRKKFVIKIVGDYAWEQYQNKFSISNFQFSKPDDIEIFQSKKYDFGTELRRKIQKFVVGKADKIIAPSEFLKKIVKGWGVKEDKIQVIYNAGPDIDKIAHTVAKAGLEGDILISAGRLEPWKGMVALVEIMPELLRKNPNFRLLIVGDGPLIENLKSKIQNLNIQDKVILAGRVPHDELMSYFKACKMFILNTGYEGLPHITLEAMACGLPVVTTNVCGNPEVVRNNYNGILTEYNNKEQLKNAILKIWENRSLREELIKNGKKTLEEFTKEKMINNTIKVLSESTNTVIPIYE